MEYCTLRITLRVTHIPVLILLITISFMSAPLQKKKTYTIVITTDKSEDGFIGRCDELHANSQGETYGEIMENMKDVVELTAKTFDGVDDFNMLVIQK